MAKATETSGLPRSGERKGTALFKWILLRGRIWIICFVGLLSLILTLVVWQALLKEEHDTAVAEFDRVAARRIEAVKRQILQGVSMINALNGLYASSRSVERGEFRVFSQPFLNDLPNVEIALYAPSVPNNLISFWENLGRAQLEDGFKVYEMTPDGQRMALQFRDTHYIDRI